MKRLQVKLRPPVVRKELTQRARLEEFLREVRQAGVTLVTAPAGFGKTSLLLQWYRAISKEGVPPAWFTVDSNVNEPGEFFGYLVASIRYSQGSSANITQSIADSDPAYYEDVQRDMLLEILEEEEDEETYLFLDDFHLLNAECKAAFSRLLEMLPPSTHFIIATRTSPDFPLARIRAEGEVIEVGSEELKFDTSEARDFFSQNLSRELKDSFIEALTSKTEGWITALQLTRLAIRRGIEPEKFIAKMSGSNRSVNDYFSEEVLSPQNEAIRDFMLHTGILDRFNSRLCDAVTEGDNGSVMIDEIESKGLFILPLDEERNWYRYHHLFSNFLTRKLEDIQPNLKEKLHYRASRWFIENDYFSEAMVHAIASNDQKYAAELLEKSCADLTYNGNIRLVAKFSKQIPGEILKKFPRTLLTLSWYHTRGLRFEESERLISLAGKEIEELKSIKESSETEIRELECLLLHRQMLLTSARDDVVTLEDQCLQILRNYPEMRHPYVVGTTYCHLLLARREQFKLEDLDKLWLSAKGVESRSPYPLLVPAIRADIGPSLFFAGKTDSAYRILEEGLAQAINYAGKKSAIAALPALPLAEIAYEKNELRLAQDLLDDALPYARKLGYTDQLMPGFLTAARLHRACHRHAEAFQSLDDGLAIALDRSLERFKVALIAEKVKYFLQDGKIDEAIAHAKSFELIEQSHTPLPRAGSCESDELRATLWTRIAIAQNNIFDALNVAKHWRSFCAKHEAVRALLKWNLLYTQILFLDGQTAEAQRPLRGALVAGKGGSMIRSFIDEGAVIKNMLEANYSTAADTNDPAEIQASMLLRVFDKGAALDDSNESEVGDESGLREKLTNNETTVLIMASHGLRNREIASRLGMTEGSIKWYMQQIYDKLGTRPRTRAIDKARKLGLIS